jgi:hypothetical protein
MIAKAVFGLCALALSAGAVAADRTPRSKADPNKIVCRTIEESGSRLRKVRACHTLAEWAEFKRQTKSTIERIQNNRPGNM